MPDASPQDVAQSAPEANGGVQRETLLRDAVSFLAYHAYMALPDCIAFRCNWMLPAVGDWAYREDRQAILRAQGAEQ